MLDEAGQRAFERWRRRASTDKVLIGSTLPMHADPRFAAAVSQLVRGEPVDASGLPIEQRRVLTKLRLAHPSTRSRLIEEWQGNLDDSQREIFCRLLDGASQHVLTMRNAMRDVAGIKWLWPGWIPFGMLTEVFGEPGIGKSAFVLGGIARPIILGTGWPDGSMGTTEPGDVLWLDTESSTAIMVQRLRDWKLPSTRIILPFQDDIFRPIDLGNSEHLQRIEYVINVRRTPLVVLDALRTAHSHDENSSKVAQVVRPLAELAERTSASIIVIHHARKLNLDEDICANDSRGSNALVALARCQIGIDRPDRGSNWLRVKVLKENLGIRPEPLGLRIMKTGVEFGPAPERPRKMKESDRAEQFLRQHMTPGKEYPAKKIIELAEQHGCSARTIQRVVTDQMGVRPVKKGNGWFWKMP